MVWLNVCTSSQQSSSGYRIGIEIAIEIDSTFGPDTDSDPDLDLSYWSFIEN